MSLHGKISGNKVNVQWRNHLLRIRLLFGGSCVVTLVINFGILPQNFEGWWGPCGTLSFYEWRLSDGIHRGGGNTHILPVVIECISTFCTHREWIYAKTSLLCLLWLTIHLVKVSKHSIYFLLLRDE